MGMPINAPPLRIRERREGDLRRLILTDCPKKTKVEKSVACSLGEERQSLFGNSCMRRRHIQYSTSTATLTGSGCYGESWYCTTLAEARAQVQANPFLPFGFLARLLHFWLRASFAFPYAFAQKQKRRRGKNSCLDWPQEQDLRLKEVGLGGKKATFSTVLSHFPSSSSSPPRGRRVSLSCAHMLRGGYLLSEIEHVRT